MVFPVSLFHGHERRSLSHWAGTRRVRIRATAFVVNSVATCGGFGVVATTDLGACVVVHGCVVCGEEDLLGGDAAADGASILLILPRFFLQRVFHANAGSVKFVLRFVGAGAGGCDGAVHGCVG